MYALPPHRHHARPRPRLGYVRVYAGSVLALMGPRTPRTSSAQHGAPSIYSITKLSLLYAGAPRINGRCVQCCTANSAVPTSRISFDFVGGRGGGGGGRGARIIDRECVEVSRREMHSLRPTSRRSQLDGQRSRLTFGNFDGETIRNVRG